MMVNRNIVIVDGSDFSLLNKFIGRDLMEVGVCVERFWHAIPAIKYLENQTADYILTSLDVAPGEGMENYSDLQNIFDQKSLGIGRPDYSEIALQVVRRIRKSKFNQSTPILVCSVSSPEGDDLYPLARKRSLEAGANDYIYAMETGWNSRILSALEKSMGKLPILR